MKPLFLIVIAAALHGQTTPSLSIKTFGAKGDRTTDDTAAIQSGFNSVCGESFAISAMTTLTIAGAGGDTNANGQWSATVLSATTIALYRDDGEPSVGNAAYTSGGIVTPVMPHLYFLAGTYNISSPLVTRCSMLLSADGPGQSVIFQTHQYTLMHGIVANHSLWMQDMAVNTTPLTVDFGMVGVFAGTSSATEPMLGDTFTFVRFHSNGFNFGLI
jgi:hypothetical protein